MKVKISKVISLLRDGYVAMDEDQTWWWHKEEPNIVKNVWIGKTESFSLAMFDIEPVKDWKKSVKQIKPEEVNG